MTIKFYVMNRVMIVVSLKWIGFCNTEKFDLELCDTVQPGVERSSGVGVKDKFRDFGELSIRKSSLVNSLNR